jgi:hypothetical protein
MEGVSDFSKPTSLLNDADVGDTPNLMYSVGETDCILHSRQNPNVTVETESRMVLKHVLKAIVAVDHLFVLGR